jgi:FMN reductase
VPLIVGLGGSGRPGSASERTLRVALASAEIEGTHTLLLGARDLDVPMYAPGVSERDEKAQRLTDALRRADGVIISTPGYHGGYSGLVKNALDYLEDLRDDARPYLDGRAVGCIVCASGWQGCVATLVALRSVAHALRAWPTPLGVVINSAQPGMFGPDGSVASADVANQLELLGRQVAEFALGQEALRGRPVISNI